VKRGLLENKHNLVVISYYNITAIIFCFGNSSENNGKSMLKMPLCILHATDNHKIITPYYNYNIIIIYQPQIIISRESRERYSSILDSHFGTILLRGLAIWA